MFVALVIMLPLLCLTAMLAFDSLRCVITNGVHIEQLDAMGYASINLAMAGVVLARLPSMFNYSQIVLQPVVNVSLAVGLFGVTLLHASRSARPVMWLQLSTIGFLVTLGVWMAFSL